MKKFSGFDTDMLAIYLTSLSKSSYTSVHSVRGPSVCAYMPKTYESMCTILSVPAFEILKERVAIAEECLTRTKNFIATMEKVYSDETSPGKTSQ